MPAQLIALGADSPTGSAKSQNIQCDWYHMPHKSSETRKPQVRASGAEWGNHSQSPYTRGRIRNHWEPLPHSAPHMKTALEKVSTMTSSTPPGPRPGQQHATPAGPYHYELGRLIELLAGLFDDDTRSTEDDST